MKKKKKKKDKKVKVKKKPDSRSTKNLFKKAGEKMVEKEKEKEDKEKETKEKILEIEKEEEKKKGEEKIKEEPGKEEKIEIPASAPFIDYIFNDFMAGKFGEVWILKPKELIGLSKATDDMMVLYAEWFLKYSVPFNFAFWLFMVLSPRWQSLKKPEKPKEPEKKDVGKEKQ